MRRAKTSMTKATSTKPRHVATSVTTAGNYGGPGVACVKTYGDVFEEHEWHPEPKYADAHGEPCSNQTIGLLHRRHVTVDHITYIGRESNQLEDVDAGLVRAGDGYTRISRLAPRLLAKHGRSSAETAFTEGVAARYRQVGGHSD